MMRLLCTTLIVALFTNLTYAADLRVGRYFSDGMVLQRGKPNAVRGTGDAGAEVVVRFGDQEQRAVADESGHWRVTLDPMEAAAKGSTLTVKSGRDKVSFKDVVVGDVILFGRQTSVDISLARDEAGRKAAASIKKSPDYRSLIIDMVPSPAPRQDLDETATSGWREVDEKQALMMSGAACMLGRDLATDVDVPVGIVDLNMGSHFPIAWLSRETLMIPVSGSGGVVGRVERIESQYEAFLNKTPWGKHKTMYEEDPRDLDFALYPAAGYNSVVLPLSGIGLKGVILQMGNDYPYMYYERAKKDGAISDRARMNQVYIKTYDIRKEGFRMEPAMITRLPADWRKALGDDSLPIAYVAPPSSKLWPYARHNVEMREIQRKVADKEDAMHLILPGMGNIPFSGQPKDEALLAKRALKWVEGALYGGTPGSGPVYGRHEGEGNRVTIHFKEGTADGLTAADGSLECFEVADVDATYVPAKAVINGDAIELSCDELSRIFYIRYNWGDVPDQGLVNGTGLPAVPFRTEDAYHKWLVRYLDDDLPMQYSTPANEWEGSAVTLINAQLERIGYPHFSGWLGPIGIKTGPFGPNMGVREVKRGSPAEGKLRVGDVIYSVNGQMLGDDEEMTMAAAITESEATDGRMLLGVHRAGENMEIELQLTVMGRYSATSPWNCLKSERIVNNLEAYLAKKGAPVGFLHADAMFLLGAGSPEHQWLVRKTATRLGGAGGNNWALGYATQYLSEYYLSTGDKRVLPQLQTLCNNLRDVQIREDSRRNGGWYGRGVHPRSYPAMSHTGVSAMLGLALARECGVDVDAETFQRGLAYLERKGAQVGQIIYGDAFRDKPQNIDPKQMLAGKLSTSNGKVAEAAVLYEVLGDRRSAYINSEISTHAWYSTYGGHGGHFWDVYWTPLGSAVHSKEAYTYFMKNHRWFRECNRMSDGSLISGGRAVAGSGLALVVPQRRLRILGAPKSPFSPGAPGELKPALDAYYARDYAKAEILALALLDDSKLDRAAAPTIGKLADEARRMLDGIAADLASIESLAKEGQLHEAGLIIAQLRPIVPEGDGSLAKALELTGSAEARPDDKALYAAALQAGAGQDPEEAAAKSADDLKKIQERKKAEAAAAAGAGRTWQCLTPKEFVSNKGKPNSEARVREEATTWTFKVLEHRDDAPEGWEQPGFDDSSWTETVHPVSWHLNHVALHRTTFTVADKDAYDLLKFKAWVFRQQDVAIYLNGNLIGRINNIEKKTGTIENEFSQAAAKYLKDGENTIAIATRQNWRWGMLSMRVYNDGFDFTLFGRQTEK
jgi:sialate O-acetylesterase